MKRLVKLVAMVSAGMGVLGVALRLLNGPREATVDEADDDLALPPTLGPGDVSPVIPPRDETPAQAVVGEQPVATVTRAMPPAVAASPALPEAQPAEEPDPGELSLAPSPSAQQPGEPAPGLRAEDRPAESFLDEGNVYFNVGQYSLAIERYSRAIELAPTLVAAYYNRANAYTRAGRYDDAVSDYDHALELDPKDGDAYNNRGMLHLYREEYSRAILDFDAALAASPGDATVAANRGLAKLHNDQAAAALADFKHAMSLDATDGAAVYGAAQASAALGNRDSALDYIGRAIGLDPRYAREAASDPRLQLLQGDDAFLKLLRESGYRDTD